MDFYLQYKDWMWIISNKDGKELILKQMDGLQDLEWITDNYLNNIF